MPGGRCGASEGVTLTLGPLTARMLGWLALSLVYEVIQHASRVGDETIQRVTVCLRQRGHAPTRRYLLGRCVVAVH